MDDDLTCQIPRTIIWKGDNEERITGHDSLNYCNCKALSLIGWIYNCSLKLAIKTSLLNNIKTHGLEFFPPNIKAVQCHWHGIEKEDDCQLRCGISCLLRPSSLLRTVALSLHSSEVLSSPQKQDQLGLLLFQLLD